MRLTRLGRNETIAGDPGPFRRFRILYGYSPVPGTEVRDGASEVPSVRFGGAVQQGLHERGDMAPVVGRQPLDTGDEQVHLGVGGG